MIEKLGIFTRKNVDVFSSYFFLLHINSLFHVYFFLILSFIYLVFFFLLRLACDSSLL